MFLWFLTVEGSNCVFFASTLYFLCMHCKICPGTIEMTFCLQGPDLNAFVAQIDVSGGTGITSFNLATVPDFCF